MGSGKEISIKKIVFTIKKIINSKSKIITDRKRVGGKSSGVQRLKCDNTLIKNTNWKVSKNFEDGLEETIEWFKINNNEELSKIYNI